jgi:hypothetical protein
MSSYSKLVSVYYTMLSKPHALSLYKHYVPTTNERKEINDYLKDTYVLPNDHADDDTEVFTLVELISDILDMSCPDMPVWMYKALNINALVEALEDDYEFFVGYNTGDKDILYTPADNGYNNWVFSSDNKDSLFAYRILAVRKPHLW